MAWYDGWAALDALKIQPGFGARASTYKPVNAQSGYSPFHVSRTTSAWGSATSGFATPKPPPIGAPEKINVGLPFSSNVAKPASPASWSTTDPFAELHKFFNPINETLGAGNFNLANLIPHFQEIPSNLFHAIEQSNVPVASQLAGAAAWQTDRLLDISRTVSGIVEPFMNAVPNWYRDSQLGDRAKVYSAMVKGQAVPWDPMRSGDLWGDVVNLGRLVTTAGAAGPFIGNEKQQPDPSSAADIASRYNDYLNVLDHGMDPFGRLDAQTKISMMRDVMDLPPSVKRALDSNPDADITALLDKAAEGRQFSYRPGTEGMARNIGVPLIFYAAEAKVGMGFAGTVARAGAVAGAPGAAGPLAAPFAAGVRGLAAGASIASKIQAASVGVGMGTYGVIATGQTIARWQGNQAATAWWDNATRTTPYSDDPRVQLVTSFTVNPFALIKPVGRAMALPFVKGGDLVLGKALGDRYARVIAPAEMADRALKAMYGPGTTEEFLAAHYETPSDRMTHVMQQAVSLIVDGEHGPGSVSHYGVTSDERIAFNHAFPDDPAKRAYAIAAKYPRQLEDAIRHPELLAANFRGREWAYMNTGTPFNPDIMAQIAGENRWMDRFTYELRQQTGSVLGYREHVPPAATAEIRSRVAAMTEADGKIAVHHKVSTTGDSWDQLLVNYPALSKFWQGTLRGEARVDASKIEEVIARADADWAAGMKQNPIALTTGSDPVLRPDSPTRSLDYADALGTDIETVRAWEEYPGKNKPPNAVDLLTTFARDKGIIDEGAVLTPDDLYNKVDAYIMERTTPWTEAGDRAVAIDAQRAGIRAQLNELDSQRPKDALGNPKDLPADLQVRHDLLMRDLEGLATLERLAGDPIRPYAERAANIRAGVRRIASPNFDERLAEAARQKVLAQTALDEIAAIDGAMQEAVNAALPREAGVAWDRLVVFKRDTGWIWGGGASEVPWTIRLKLAKFRHPDATDHVGVARDMVIDEGLPGLVGDIHRAGTPFRNRLTAKEAAVVDGLQPGISMDEIVGSQANRTSSGMEAQEALKRDIIASIEKRDAILADASTGSIDALKKRAAKPVPAEYLGMANDALAGRYLDPEMVARDHPGNIAIWMKALDQKQPVEALTRGTETDAIIADQLARLAEKRGQTLDDLIHDETAYPEMRAAIVPADFVPPVPGQLRPMSSLDDLIVQAQDPAVKAQIRDLTAKLQADREAPPAPIPDVTPEEFAAVEAMSSERLSRTYHERLDGLGADLSARPSQGLMDAASNQIGMQILSVINHGVIDTQPATLRGLLAIQRAIEDGRAAQMGFGPDLVAEGQKTVKVLLNDAVKTTKQAAFDRGTMTTGMDPALISDDWLKMSQELFVKHPDAIIEFDPTAPAEMIRYGLKKPPNDAVLMEWSTVPGLAEEFLTSHFQPFAERVGTARVRQMYNYVFGPLRNDIQGAEARTRFVSRLAAQGVDTQVADAVWKGWQEAKNSVILPFIGEHQIYGTVRNIPNEALNRIARESVGAQLAKAEGMVSSDYRALATGIDFATEFREATSTIRRNLADHGGPLGDVLAGMYGAAAHNAFATTWYYIFRFGLDARFHAQNWVEPYILQAGRAGMKAPLREAYLGESGAFMKRQAENSIFDTGYPYIGGTRAKVANDTFRRLQKDTLLKGIDAEDPRLMDSALLEMARVDPELAATIKVMGDTPESWLEAMDAHYKKILATKGDEEVGALLAGDFDRAIAETPAMAEVYSALRVHNQNLIHDLRTMFFGNDERSRIERVLNHYLLFWPISYQLKATKWMVNTLFKSVGGLPTNAAGAYALDGLVTLHTRQLQSDPAYRDWFETHQTLTFIAQMLLPISPDSVGVSLNPGLRSIFFGRSKAVWDVGPIYTLTDLGPKLIGELYPSISGVPGMDGLYRASTGVEPGQSKITVGKATKSPSIDEFLRGP